MADDTTTNDTTTIEILDGDMVIDRCTVAELLADNEGDEEVADAVQELLANGTAWIGGGASPLVQIRKA